jgi:hypothetical protein
VFLQSYLINILKNVLYATPVEGSNFPEEWKQKAQPANKDHGACTSGTGTRQQRGGAKGRHRAQDKHPQPHTVTQEQAKDTTAGGNKDDLVHFCMGHGGSTQGDPTLWGTITGGSYYNQEGTRPHAIGTQDGMINVIPKLRT